MNEWAEATLGDLFLVDNAKLGPHVEEPTVLSLSKYDGFVRADEYFDKRVASSKLDSYKVVEPGEWAFSTIHIDEGSIARNNLGERGVISPMYTTMQLISERCTSDYAELLVRLPSMLVEYSRRAQGSINRRRSLPFRAFAEIPVALPTRSEQRRIVDVMAAVDAQIETLRVELESGRAAQEPLIGGLLAEGGDDWPIKPLGEVGDFIRGRRFTKADYAESGLGCIHYGQIHTTLGLITFEPLTYLPELFRKRMRLASPGDVVIAGTSENTEDLGNATVWLGNDNVAVHDDAYIFKHELEPVFASCLFVSPEFQKQKIQYAAGTKVTRISGDNLGKIKLPIPPKELQAKIGDAVRALEEGLRNVESELANLRAFRATLLTSLLHQEIEIPESYDVLLEEVS